MSVVVCGCSFKTAPIEVREELAFAEDEVRGELESLVTYDGIGEALVISTCNRVELYVDAKTDRIGVDSLRDYVSKRMNGNYDAKHFYSARGMDAAEHLFRVVCSLDSQVLGEAQILGQAKRAFEQAVDAGTCGTVLTKLFKTALSLGKRVRSETGIGQDSVSLSTTAYKVACRVFPDLASRRICVVGTGEMAKLALVYLDDAGCNDVVVIGRRIEAAQDCATIVGGRAVTSDDLYTEVAQSDIVFTMTSADEPVICARELEQARLQAQTSGKHLLIIDEALPRDVEQACAELEGVELYNLEALASIIDESAFERLAAVGDVERMASDALEEFLSWMQQRQVAPTIKEMYEKADSTVDSQLEHAIRSLSQARGAEISQEEQEILAAFGNAIVKKMLHGPTSRLRKEASTADSYYYTGAARYLFGLDTYPPGQEHVRCSHECLDNKPCPNQVPAIHQDQCASKGRA